MKYSFQKNKIFLYFIFLLSSFCCFSLSFAGLYDDGDEFDDPPKIKTPIYAIDKTTDLISKKKLEYGKPRIVVKSVFPLLESNDIEYEEDEDDNIKNFNTLISEILQETIEEYTTLVVDNQEAQKKLPKSAIKNSLYTDYDTSVVKPKGHRIISLRFTIQGTVAGLRRAYRAHKVLNYSLDDGRILALSDLFQPSSDYLNIISAYASQRLYKRLSNHVMVANGTMPTLENFKNWNIKANGLLFTFDEEQVAPKILGAQTVFVPFSVLKDVLAKDSPMYDCIKNKRRCANSNILTGGFIDEASNHHSSAIRHLAMRK